MASGNANENWPSGSKVVPRVRLSPLMYEQAGNQTKKKDFNYSSPPAKRGNGYLLVGGREKYLNFNVPFAFCFSGCWRQHGIVPWLQSVDAV